MVHNTVFAFLQRKRTKKESIMFHTEKSHYYFKTLLCQNATILVEENKRFSEGCVTLSSVLLLPALEVTQQSLRDFQ